MKVNMFDVFYANLKDNAVKSEQGGIRPVVVVQNDVGNKYSPTIIVLPITSEIKKINMPTHCILHKSDKNGLSKNSMVLAEQVRVIDKSRLIRNRISHRYKDPSHEDLLNHVKKYRSQFKEIVTISKKYL